MPGGEARKIVQALSQTNHQSRLSAWLFTSLVSIVKTNGQQFNKENLWILFLELTVSTKFAKKWKTFACSLGIGTLSPVLYQHITYVLFETIIKESLSVSTDGSISTGDTQDG